MPVTVKAGVQPHNLYIAAAAGNVAERLKITLRLTSGIDGAHAPASLHYALRALDFGTWEHKGALKDAIVREFVRELGSDYDVLLEHRGVKGQEHVHVEFDP
jgi:hypothetical protein